MKVIIIADTEGSADFARHNTDVIERAIRDCLFWPNPAQEVQVAVQLRAPSREELLGLLAAMGAEPTPEEQLEWEYAELEEMSRRPGSGVYRP